MVASAKTVFVVPGFPSFVNGWNEQRKSVSGRVSRIISYQDRVLVRFTWCGLANLPNIYSFV